ncbi:MAG: CBS domain-containing protein [Desulfobacteraceae bacterium]|nr:CBS domain-containing protein [Desulfobacteraceae bacterium]
MPPVITTHKNTDFDALASTIGAKILYPDAKIVLPKQVNPNVKAFLSIHKDLFDFDDPDQIDMDGVDQLIVVDTNKWERLDGVEMFRDRKGLTVHIWDHHSIEGDIDSSWSCVETVGATITLIVKQLQKERKLITPIQATLFLAGIYEDTGNLSFPSSTADDAYAVAYLLERKADLTVVGKFLSPAYGEKQKDILFKILKTGIREKIRGFTVCFGRMEIKGHVQNLALVVSMYKDIMNADASFGIFTTQNGKRTIIIGRSSTDGLDMSLLMRSLGGGGHPGAGSALLKKVNPDTVEEMIRELINGNQQASVQISDLMSFPVVSIAADAKMQEVARLLREKGCTGVPVVDKDEKLVGIISRRDFKKIRRRSDLKKPVKAYMSTNIRTIEPGMSPGQAARIMVRYDVGRLPVVAGDGRMIGIITRSDTMLYFYDLLPD